MNDTLKKQLRELPYVPGVYLMKDFQGKIIYIGKAKKLHERVSSYFVQNQNHSRKTRRLIQQIVTIDTVEVTTELDALLLECQLIQQYRPLYNRQLNAFERYRYLSVTTSAAGVTLKLLSQPKGNYCFGPFSASKRLSQIKRILEELYGLRSRNRWQQNLIIEPKPIFSNELIFTELLDAFTKGGQQPQIRLKKQMLQAAENHAFERAAAWKEAWQLVTHFFSQNQALYLAHKTTWQLLALPFKKKIKYYLLFQGLVIATRTITKQTFSKYTPIELAKKIRPNQSPIAHTHFEKTEVDLVIILARYLNHHEECLLYKLPASF